MNMHPSLALDLDTSEKILTIITGLIAIVAGVKASWQWFWAKIDAKSLRKQIGAELYTEADIKRAIRYYVPHSCQQAEPYSEGEPRPAADSESLFRRMDEYFSDPAKFHYIILLADSGMGKTSALINYYARHIGRAQYRWRRFRRRPFDLKLVLLGHPDATGHILEVKGKRNTILLLDALDEDTRDAK